VALRLLEKLYNNSKSKEDFLRGAKLFLTKVQQKDKFEEKASDICFTEEISTESISDQAVKRIQQDNENFREKQESILKKVSVLEKENNELKGYIKGKLSQISALETVFAKLKSEMTDLQLNQAKASSNNEFSIAEVHPKYSEKGSANNSYLGIVIIKSRSTKLTSQFMISNSYTIFQESMKINPKSQTSCLN
jgi:predicted RNase H-like nuclease (RuvC/YqgF family)